MNIKLENLAKDMFLNYAYRKTGVHPNWQYLSPERRLAWMREVSDIFEMCLQHLGDSITLPPSIGMPAASYEKGFLAGQSFENKRLAAKIQSIKNNIEEQIEEFELDHASR
jgi:hypothetical protein